MTIARFFLFLLCLFLLPAAYSQSGVFLSYDQFLELSDNQKKSYIEMLREHTLSLSKNPYLTSSVKQKPLLLDHLLQNFISSAGASESPAVDKECSKDIRGLSNQDLLSAFSLTMNCTEIRSTKKDPVYYSPVAIRRVESLATEFFSRVDTQKLTPGERHYHEAIGTLKGVIEDLKQKGTRTQKLDPSWMSAEYNRLDSMEPSGSITKHIKAAPTSSKQAPTKLAAAASPVSAKVSAAETEVNNSYRCLYAGFVIPKTQDKCTPYKELPFTSDFLNSKTFICPDQNQILCNPLLFGFEDTDCATTGIKTCKGKRPVCVYKSSDATKNCYENAKRKKTISQTLEIWKSPEGEKLYKDYIDSLNKLCDKADLAARKLRPSAFNDITKTCEVANSVLKENIQNEFLNGKTSLPDPKKSSGKQ